MEQYKPPSPPISTILTMLRLASTLDPESDTIWSNLGWVNWNHGCHDVARKAFQKAICANPKNANNYRTAGIFHLSLGEWDEAERYLIESDALSHDADIQLDLAHLHLKMGDWKAGLIEYDARIRSKSDPFPKLPYPMWDGKSDLNGKTIFIQCEQGVGDHILFSRYLAWLKHEWPDSNILLGIYADLQVLFWDFRHLVTFIPSGVPWPQGVDCGFFLMSLMRPHWEKYGRIPSDPGLIAKSVISRECAIREPLLPSLKVAICWTGNYEANNNIARSVPLVDLLSLVEDPRISLYSIQCGKGKDDIERYGAAALLTDLSGPLEDQGWPGTAAALRKFDVIITVCTGIAHLAGALGLNCWTLLSQQPFWIWPREGSTTDWYPSMRLFRQERLGDWSGVISQVKHELSVLADVRFPLCHQ